MIEKREKKMRFRPQDLTKEALQRIVEELLMADDGDEERVLAQLADQDKESEDLVQLNEEKRGAPKKIVVEDDMPQKGKR